MNAPTNSGVCDRTLRSWRFAEIPSTQDVARYWAATAPAKVALIDLDRRRTFAELDRRASRIANRLIAGGVKPGTNIGYMGKNTIEFFEIWFGAAKARCAVAPFNWRCTADELTEVADDARPPLVFSSLELVDVMKTVQSRVKQRFQIVPFTLSDLQSPTLDDWIADASHVDPKLVPSPDDTTLLSYTSGTTGLPKGVMATQRAFQAVFLSACLEHDMAWRDDDVMLVSMPVFHLGGSLLGMNALYHGVTLTIVPAFEPASYLAAIRRDRATNVALVPAAMQILLDYPGFNRADFSSVRSMMYFGSPIAPEVTKRALETFGCELMQSYGATEVPFTTILRHAEHRSAKTRRLASCGVPMPLVSVKVVDESGEEVPSGTIGQVLVRSPMAFAGYHGRPEATAEAYKDGWYHTGDLGEVDEDGFLYLVDRLKDMIISGGENVYSTEVERALIKLPGVASCAVVGVPDAKWGQRVVAAVVRGKGATFTEAEAIAHCRNLIAGYKTPKQVVFVDAMPTTTTGKVKKGELRKLLMR